MLEVKKIDDKSEEPKAKFIAEFLKSMLAFEKSVAMRRRLRKIL